MNTLWSVFMNEALNTREGMPIAHIFYCYAMKVSFEPNLVLEI